MQKQEGRPAAIKLKGVTRQEMQPLKCQGGITDDNADSKS